MHIMLKGKRVLLISVKFFNYECLIKEQLEQMGAVVDLFDERPSNSFFSKAIIRIKKELYRVKVNAYFNEIIAQIKDNTYDYFLLIKGEVIPPFFLEFLKQNNPAIQCIFYTYDSFKNNANGLEILRYFDKKFTFDNADAQHFNLSFRPLFYAQSYSELYTYRDGFSRDLSFIGTAHSDRYEISEQLKKWCEGQALKMFTFYYSPSKLMLKIKKIYDRNVQALDLNQISFKSLTHDQIIQIYRETRAVLDINHPNQKGLTMRTFETLGAGRKLITTNAAIKKYSFYDPQNILVISRDNIHVEKSFFQTEFKAIEVNILYSMSLEGWVKEVFGLTSSAHWEHVMKDEK